MRNLLFLIGLITLFASCSTERTLTQVKLKEGTRILNLYENDKYDKIQQYYIIVYETTDSVVATVKISETEIRIIPNDINKAIPIDTISLGANLGLELERSYRIANKYSYKNELQKKSADKSDINLISLDKNIAIPNYENRINESYTSFNSIKYRSSQYFLQTLTVPFKFRGKANGKPNNVSTGFNAGFAYGKLWNWQKITPIYSTEDFKMKGYYKRVFAFGIAPFIGLTTVNLDSDNTQNNVTKEKTVLGGTIGGIAVIKFNAINIGLGLGFDYGFNESSNWDYQGKPWLGLILGLDLIK